MATVSKKHGTGLFVRILIAIVFGVVLGLVLPDFGVRMLKTFSMFSLRRY